MIPNGFWIETYTGKQFDVQNPDVGVVDQADIAHALSMQVRFNGHCHRFYSVAEHSVHIARYIKKTLGYPPAIALAGLLHDAGEAYTGDFPSPFKWAMPELKQLEEATQRAVYQHFGIGPEHYKHGIIDELDKRILVDERRQLMSDSGLSWAIDDLEPLGVTIRNWDPAEAEGQFLTTFYILQEEVRLWVQQSQQHSTSH